MGSKNTNGRKTLALLAATATLAGGLTAGTAYAGGGGGDQGGTGGGGSSAQFWSYKDDASGSWGSATDLNSVSRAMAAVGVTMDDSAGKAAKALSDANAECVAGFRQRHPGEGDGDCRVVAVARRPATGPPPACGTGPASMPKACGRITGTNTLHQATTIMPDLVTIRLLLHLMTIRRTASTRSWNAMSARPAASS